MNTHASMSNDLSLTMTTTILLLYLSQSLFILSSGLHLFRRCYSQFWMVTYLIFESIQIYLYLVGLSMQALHSILEEFAAQRRYREQRRNQYLRRFEHIRQSVGFDRPRQYQHLQHPYQANRVSQGHNIQHHQYQPIANQNGQPLRQNQQPQLPQHEHTHSHHNQPPISQLHLEQPHHRQLHQPQHSEPSEVTSEEHALLNQHKQLTRTMQELQAKSQQQLEHFRSALETAKTKYVSEIAKLVEHSNSSQQQLQSKMTKLQEQIESALRKNQEIDTVNTSLRNELSNQQQGDEKSSLQYLNEMRKQYDQKIAAFKSVFDASNQKIEALEKEFNEEEFIESTIKNQELLKSIEENASKAEEASKILEDYKTLSEGKKEILAELRGSMEMKQKEIEKMCQLQQKMKSIMDRLNQEKQIYVQENSRMAKELMEIKELLMASVGQSQTE